MEKQVLQNSNKFTEVNTSDREHDQIQRVYQLNLDKNDLEGGLVIVFVTTVTDVRN